MTVKKILATTAVSLAVTTGAYAGCGLKGDINVLSNAYPLMDSLKKDLQECKGNGFSMAWKQNKDHKTEIVTAFSSKSNPYDVAVVSNSILSNIQSKGLIRPLDDLVKKYKKQYNIEDSMLIRVDGKIYAIAFQANAQHFMYRKDLFKKYGLSAPKTYDDVLNAAKKLKSSGAVEYPFGAAFKSGWNLAQEFNNIFLGYGGKYFQSGSLKPAFNSDAGVKAIELMKKLKAEMSPNALVLDSGAVQNQLRQGKIAMAFLWASRAAGMDEADKSSVVDKIAFTGAPAVIAGGNSATTTWWDGIVLPKNSRGNDDVAFKAAMEILSEKATKKHPDTIWLRSSYTPTKYATGVIESFKAGAPVYPLEPAYGLIHSAIGKVLGDALTGTKTSQEALKEAEEIYKKSAMDKGYW